MPKVTQIRSGLRTWSPESWCPVLSTKLTFMWFLCHSTSQTLAMPLPPQNEAHFIQEEQSITPVTSPSKLGTRSNLALNFLAAQTQTLFLKHRVLPSSLPKTQTTFQQLAGRRQWRVRRKMQYLAYWLVSNKPLTEQGRHL